jgi:hypothetical protein
MFFIVSDIIMILFSLVFFVAVFFAFDEIILKGYFATKLRKRFNVEEIK